jgi:hypothetical protein
MLLSKHKNKSYGKKVFRWINSLLGIPIKRKLQNQKEPKAAKEITKTSNGKEKETRATL